MVEVDLYLSVKIGSQHIASVRAYIWVEVVTEVLGCTEVGLVSLA